MCPCCGAEFEAQTVAGVTVAACRACSGAWLNAGEFDKLCELKLEHEFDSWMSEPTECRHCDLPLGFGANCVHCGRQPTISCVKGHGIMNATLVEVAEREFEIDHCPSCRGIWIDGHERTHLRGAERRPARSLPIHHEPPTGVERAYRSLAALDARDSLALEVLLGFTPIVRPRERREPVQVLILLVVALAVLAVLSEFVPHLMAL